MKKVSVKSVARRQASADKLLRRGTVDAITKDLPKGTSSVTAVPTADSFTNFAFKMGIGADNPLTSAGYGFNPITRVRTMLEWIHRGSWLGGVVIDVVAEDMTRAGITLEADDLDPDARERIDEAAVALQVWKSLCSAIKWARLYGGAIAVFMVEGQNMETPLRINTIAKGQFKGLLVLDRWTVDPSLNDLVTEFGPNLGKPKFYKVQNDAQALRNMKIHYSRVIRLEGIELPYWQKVMENLWGESVLERLYDRMIAFDSATTGAAQLVYKAYLRTYKIDGLRENIAAGGPQLEGLVRYTEMIRRFQSIEGMTLLDRDDEMEAMQTTAFSGLSDALTQFAQQLSGATGIPLVRLFGQSPSGFNSGDTDLRNYYDKINKEQSTELTPGVTTLYRCLGQTVGSPLKDTGVRLKFNSLWQLDDKEKAEIANSTAEAVSKAADGGLISQATSMRELQTSSRITGIFTHITDKDIKAADEELPPSASEAMEEQQANEAEAALASGEAEMPEGEADPTKPKPKEKPDSSKKPEPSKKPEKKAEKKKKDA